MSSELLKFLLDEDDYFDDVVECVVANGLIDDLRPSKLVKTLEETPPGTENQVVWDTSAYHLTRDPSKTHVIMDMLSGPPDRGYDHFRLSNTIFHKFLDVLVSKGLLTTTRSISVQEQLAFFLYGIGHGITNRAIAEKFHHSGETISRYFSQVLLAIVTLKDEYFVQPDSNVDVHPQIRESPNFFPFFENALGAVDAKHVPAILGTEDQQRLKNNRSFTVQNVMAACSFDYSFLFVCTGLEGSTSDMWMLRWCLESGGFKVPEGKYYLVDQAYTNTDKFLAPYQGSQYHLSTFEREGTCDYADAKDLFNHRHAQLRNCVEKAFQILTSRFKILQAPMHYPFKTQCHIVIACCIIHNFIRRNGESDFYFSTSVPSEQNEEDVANVDSTVIVSDDEAQRGEELRQNITTKLWEAHKTDHGTTCYGFTFT